MATTIQFLRSDISQQRPDPSVLSDGMPMVNTNQNEPGLFFKARDGSLFKAGPVAIGSEVPNSSPNGSAGNAKGEMWLDTSAADNPALRIYDGSQWVLATASTSYLEVSGTDLSLSSNLVPDANNTRNLGSSELRFANVYTGDLHLSNSGSSNDVDGTWGDYVIQEGERDLYLINRRTGQKLKFLTEEV